LRGVGEGKGRGRGRLGERKYLVQTRK